MKEINPISESFYDKITKSRFLPDWAKATIAISLALTPLLEILYRYVLVKQVADLITKLLGL
jgi:hypothetical protein